MQLKVIEVNGFCTG